MVAGIVATHRHFPVFSAYALAEELTASAKKTKQVDHRLGALDFHVLYDSSTGGTLRQLRARRSSKEASPILGNGGPYLVTSPSGDEARQFEQLKDLLYRREKLRTGDHNHRRLLHGLREALLESSDVATTTMTGLCLRATTNAELLSDDAREALDHGQANDGTTEGEPAQVPSLWSENEEGIRVTLIPDLVDMEQLIADPGEAQA